MRRLLALVCIGFVLPAPAVTALCPSRSPAKIGLVLSGGGSFGAFQVGALIELFDYWSECLNELPPITAAAGTSTGALISPFALFSQDELRHLEYWYTHVQDKDILKNSLWNFLVKGVSLSDFGYRVRRNCMRLTDDCNDKAGRLYCNYKCALRPSGKDLLTEVIRMWPHRRVAVTTIDFSSGKSHVVVSSPPAGVEQTNLIGETAFRRAIFASAIPPLIGPPVPLTPEEGGNPTPHYDGGVHSQAPFDTLFAAAALETPIEFTHLILLSSFPEFPGKDEGGVQPGTYPGRGLKNIADRFNTLLAEASATRDLRVVRAAIRLREMHVSPPDVEALTGLKILGTPKLVVVSPRERLGWRAFRFGETEMGDMVKRGKAVARTVYENTNW